MDSANCDVRLAESAEALEIADLLIRSRRAATGIPASVHDDPDVRAWARDRLLPTCEVWVATEGRDLAGVMALRDEWIEQLYISPAHQRRRHGSRLVERAKATRDSLALWTFERNLGARQFYEAHGFTQAGAPSSDNEERAPAIRYRWRPVG